MVEHLPAITRRQFLSLPVRIMPQPTRNGRVFTAGPPRSVQEMHAARLLAHRNALDPLGIFGEPSLLLELHEGSGSRSCSLPFLNLGEGWGAQQEHFSREGPVIRLYGHSAFVR